MLLLLLLRWQSEVQAGCQPLLTLVPQQLASRGGVSLVQLLPDRMLLACQCLGSRRARLVTRPLLPLEPLVVALSTAVCRAGSLPAAEGKPSPVDCLLEALVQLLLVVVRRHCRPMAPSLDERSGEGLGLHAGTSRGAYQALLAAARLGGRLPHREGGRLGKCCCSGGQRGEGRRKGWSKRVGEWRKDTSRLGIGLKVVAVDRD